MVSVRGLNAKGVAAIALASCIVASPLVVVAGGPGHCPPGLAKKGSCTPPGQQKSWSRGERIPDDVRLRIVRADDYGLRRPRGGEVYVESGGRVYLLSEATQRVIEAVNLADRALR